MLQNILTLPLCCPARNSSWSERPLYTAVTLSAERKARIHGLVSQLMLVLVLQSFGPSDGQSGTRLVNL